MGEGEDRGDPARRSSAEGPLDVLIVSQSVDHGVAIYRGLRHMQVAGTEGDYLHLEYLGGDRLYLPVDRINLVQRYVSGDGAAPPLDKLGGTSWERVKAKTRESLLALLDADGLHRFQCDDHLRLVLLRELGDLVHVHELVLAAHVVGDDVVELPRDVQLHPVREVAAVVQGHPHDRVARVDQRHVGRVVGLGPGVRLDVHVLRAEHLLGPVDGQLLGDVDPLAAAVVALARIALGVLVGEYRALRGEHRGARVVLRGEISETYALEITSAPAPFVSQEIPFTSERAY